MEREIRFRGKTTGTDTQPCWVHGHYVHLKDSFRKRETHRIYSGYADSMPEGNGYDFFGTFDEIDPETLGQFTGLYDKNGKEIYEGDILRSDKYPYSLFDENGNAELDNYYAVVGWADDEACFNIWCTKSRTSRVQGISDGINSIIENPENFEVVGNIYDNKLLLNEDFSGCE